MRLSPTRRGELLPPLQRAALALSRDRRRRSQAIA
jgi:hypothetical protein